MKIELTTGPIPYNILKEPVHLTLGPFKTKSHWRGETVEDVVEDIKGMILADFEFDGPISRFIKEFAEKASEVELISADYDGNPV